MESDESIKTKKSKNTKNSKKSKTTEWSLFWHGLLGEAANEGIDAKALELAQIQALTADQIKQIIKMLSLDRKDLNQQIEKINRDIDACTERLKSLELVGGKQEETLEQISKFNDMGYQLSQRLLKVDNQLRRFREREDEIKAAGKANHENQADL